MKKKNIISIGLIALLCISCNNYLDIKPYGRTIPKTAKNSLHLFIHDLTVLMPGQTVI